MKAERAGFEPAVRFDPHTAFPVPHLRPLGHLSEIAKEPASVRYVCGSAEPPWQTVVATAWATFNPQRRSIQYTLARRDRVAPLRHAGGAPPGTTLPVNRASL